MDCGDCGATRRASTAAEAELWQEPGHAGLGSRHCLATVSTRALLLDTQSVCVCVCECVFGGGHGAVYEPTSAKLSTSESTASSAAETTLADDGDIVA